MYGALSLPLPTDCWAIERLPTKVGKFVLAEPVPQGSIVQSAASPYVHKGDPLQYEDVTAADAKRMLGKILPHLRSAKVSAHVRLYRGRIEYISIEIGDKNFKEIHALLFKKFGKGLQADSYVRDVLDGCDPYSFQQWASHGGQALFLIGDVGNGVDLYLRDQKLHAIAEEDDQVHIEHEQCVEF